MSRYPPKKPATKKVAGKKKAAPKKAAAKPAKTTERRAKKTASESSWASRMVAEAAKRADKLERLEGMRRRASARVAAASQQSPAGLSAAALYEEVERTRRHRPRWREAVAKFGAAVERGLRRLVGAKSAE